MEAKNNSAGISRVGVLTGGGDCPGLNAVIRSVTKSLIYDYGVEVFGIYDGYAGLVEHRYQQLLPEHVSNILTLGGTILGSSNTANPFAYYPAEAGGPPTLPAEDRSAACSGLYSQLGLDALVCIGGDGTMAIADRLRLECGLNIVGVPKTIDNDLAKTDVTFGFDTAVQTATEAIDRLHTTASSHHRIMLAEVMGRYAGWIALYAGAASGADVILIPEIPYRLDRVLETIERRNRCGKRFSIVCVAEGAKPVDGEMTVERIVKDSPDPIRLGGIGHKLARELEDATGIESRATVLGYVQRGGSPTADDRTLATQLGYHAAQLIMERRFGRMVAVQGSSIGDVLLEEVANRIRTVPLDHSLLLAAKAVGTCFGE